MYGAYYFRGMAQSPMNIAVNNRNEVAALMETT